MRSNIIGTLDETTAFHGTGNIPALLIPIVINKLIFAINLDYLEKI